MFEKILSVVFEREKNTLLLYIEPLWFISP